MQCRLVDVTAKIKHTDSWLYSSCLHFKKETEQFRGAMYEEEGKDAPITDPPISLAFYP